MKFLLLYRCQTGAGCRDVRPCLVSEPQTVIIFLCVLYLRKGNTDKIGVSLNLEILWSVHLQMKRVDFNNGHIFGNILQTAFPMLVAQVLNLLYSIVDRIYIGRIPGLGTEALGAVGLCFPIIILVTAFTNMFGSGGSPLFSMALGEGNTQKAAQIQNTAFRLLSLTALLIMVITELFGGPLLLLFGATAADLPVSLPYLRVYMLGTLFIMLSTGMNSYINAQGFPVIGMLSVTIGAVINLILDPIFIFAFGMGVVGAAIATVIAQFLSFCFVLRFLFGRKNEFPIRFAWSFPYAGSIVSLGLSPFIMQFTNSLVQIACNSMLMQYGGTLYVSIMTIVSSVRSILDVPVQSITEGSSPIISFNYGAKRPENVKKAICVMLLLAFPYTLATWLFVNRMPGLFVRIFSDDTDILTDASRALHLYFYAFIFQSLQYSGQTVFKSLNKKNRAIFFSLFRKVILVVPLTCLLPGLWNLGTDGVFIAEPISNVLGGLACFITMLATIIPELNRMRDKLQNT